MSVHSGKFACVNGRSTVRNWSINDANAPAKVVASNTLGAHVRKKGVRSWTGSFAAFGAVPLVLPRETFTFTGYTAPDDDASGAGEQYSGTAMVSSVVITWNWANGEPLSYVCNFDGHLALSTSSGTTTDATAVDAPIVALTKVQYDPGSGYVDLPNLTQAVLTISAANQAYVNSSTVVSGQLWTGRKAGVLDWTLALSQQDNIRVSGIFNVDDDVKLKLFTDATLFWELWWGHVREFTGIQANTETGAILARTINMDMNGYNAANGKINKPGAVVWWP